MKTIGWPLSLLAIAILCRVILLVELRQAPTYQHPEGGDSILYDKVASGAPEPARAYFHSPLYQSFLGGLYRVFGRDLTLVRVVQHVAGCMMVLLVWVTTRQLFGSRAIAGVAGEVEALGRGNLSTEVSFLNGRVVPYGTRGSVRLDVVEGPLNSPTAVFDFKTGTATLSPARITEIRSHLPGGGGNVPILEIR